MITYICLEAVICLNTSIRGVTVIPITTFMLDHPWKKKYLHRVNLNHFKLTPLNSLYVST